MSEPTQTVLTPAQVEVLEQLLADRETRILATVEGMIAAAVAEAVHYGGRIALRTATYGVTVCVHEGGPHEAGEPIRLESRLSVGPWESFTVERGQV